MFLIAGLFRYLFRDGGAVQAVRIDGEVTALAIPFGAARIQFGKKPLRFRLPCSRQKMQKRRVIAGVQRIAR